MNYSFITMVLSWIIIGGVSAYIAKQRHRNPVVWFFIGLIFYLFGLLFLLILPSKKPASTEQKDVKVPDIKQMNSESTALADGSSYPIPHNTLRISRDSTIEWYFIDAFSAIVGPLKLIDLRKALIERKLDLQTYLWCEEFPDWAQIKDLQNGASILDPDFL